MRADFCGCHIVAIWYLIYVAFTFASLNNLRHIVGLLLLHPPKKVKRDSFLHKMKFLLYSGYFCSIFARFLGKERVVSGLGGKV